MKRRVDKMKNILVIQGGGRANGNTAQLVSSFAKGVEDVDFSSAHAEYSCSHASV